MTNIIQFHCRDDMCYFFKSTLIISFRYDAKIIKIRSEKMEVLIHFDGWNSRFDIWLPYNSNKLRQLKSVKTKGQVSFLSGYK